MGLVDYDEPVVAPVHVAQVDVAGQPAIAGQVGVVEDVERKPIRGKRVADVIAGPQGPVVPQALRGQHEHALIPQLEIADDGKRLERLSQPHAIGNDASTPLSQLTNCA